LIFKSYELGDTLQSKAFNVQEPLHTKLSIELEKIHLLILPCVGAYMHIDSNNHQTNLHRIGYGAGFYDKTLAGLNKNNTNYKKPFCVGLAFNQP
jgi:5-formyltetrahydrofolate cyclo-ligase